MSATDTNAVEQPILSPSRRLPSGRAVLGALLITLAVLGILLATRLGDQATIRRVVVATEDLAPGTVLEPQHLTSVEIRLAEEVDFVFENPEDLYGTVLLGPLDESEFVQFANLAAGNPDSVPTGLVEVSIEVEAVRAPSSLTAGELVTLVATFPNDEPAVTRVIARNVPVLSYDPGNSEFNSTGDTVLRLGIDDGETASEIVTASITGDVSVIGVTGATNIEIAEVTG